MTDLNTLNDRLAALMEKTGTPMQDIPSPLPPGALTGIVTVLIALVEALTKRVEDMEEARRWDLAARGAQSDPRNR